MQQTQPRRYWKRRIFIFLQSSGKSLWHYWISQCNNLTRISALAEQPCAVEQVKISRVILGYLEGSITRTKPALFIDSFPGTDTRRLRHKAQQREVADCSPGTGATALQRQNLPERDARPLRHRSVTDAACRQRS